MQQAHGLGFYHLWQKPRIPFTTSSHEPLSASAGVQRGFHEPSWVPPTPQLAQNLLLWGLQTPLICCGLSARLLREGALKSVRPGAEETEQEMVTDNLD